MVLSIFPRNLLRLKSQKLCLYPVHLFVSFFGEFLSMYISIRFQERFLFIFWILIKCEFQSTLSIFVDYASNKARVRTRF